ncbi:MAG: flagellar assembly protein FliX [Alphaproteobacteria bacterium]|nr:flagellar assembly protein FliX [Alphaproteobacteria bacterium]
MKIQGPGRTQGTDKAKKSGKAGQADGSFGDFMASAPQKAAPAAATHSIAHVDALLAVQAAEDPAQGASRKRMKHRANLILDELDNIRMAMLGGTLTVGHMVDIADIVASHREKIADPALTALMDEVDLRAQVELAKLRAALERG